MSDPRVIMIDYTNWKGERRRRVIQPLELVFQAVPPWHPVEAWMIRALDLGKNEERHFLLHAIHQSQPWNVTRFGIPAECEK